MTDPTAQLMGAFARYDARQDTDGDRDYAEEAAVRAEQNAENREEQAHADLVAETVRQLRALAGHAHDDARVTVLALRDEVNLRLAPNVHRYELLARQQHVALLAAMVAAAIEETGEYDLGKVARGVVSAHVLQHTDGDLFGRAVRHAGERVENTVAEVAHMAQQAATDREVAAHERDLAERDA